MSGESEAKRSWWQSLPGILTGIAAILASVAALLPVIEARTDVPWLKSDGTIETATVPAAGATTDVGSAIDAELERTLAALEAAQAELEARTVAGSRPLAVVPVEPAAEVAVDLPADLPTDLPAIEDSEDITPPSPGWLRLRVKTWDRSADEIVIAFTDADPAQLVTADDLDSLILRKITFSGRSGFPGVTFKEDYPVTDTSFLGARYVVVYNEGSNGWDGWLQLIVDQRVVLEERIRSDLKNFRRPEMASHRYWSKELRAGS